MKLEDLEYTDFALRGLIKDLPLEKFVFSKALYGIKNFLLIYKSHNDIRTLNQYDYLFEGIIRVFKRQLLGQDCIKEVVESLYCDFEDFIMLIYK